MATRELRELMMAEKTRAPAVILRPVRPYACPHVELCSAKWDHAPLRRQNALAGSRGVADLHFAACKPAQSDGLYIYSYVYNSCVNLIARHNGRIQARLAYTPCFTSHHDLHVAGIPSELTVKLPQSVVTTTSGTPAASAASIQQARQPQHDLNKQSLALHLESIPCMIYKTLASTMPVQHLKCMLQLQRSWLSHVQGRCLTCHELCSIICCGVVQLGLHVSIEEAPGGCEEAHVAEPAMHSRLQRFALSQLVLLACPQQ